MMVMPSASASLTGRSATDHVRQQSVAKLPAEYLADIKMERK